MKMIIITISIFYYLVLLNPIEQHIDNYSLAVTIMMQNTQKRYLGMGPVTLGNARYSTELSRFTCQVLRQHLAILPTAEVLRDVSGNVYFLELRIESVDSGCYATRSSLLLMLLGLGAVHLKLFVRLRKADGEIELERAQPYRHRGLNKYLDADHYLIDNSKELIAELVERITSTLIRDINYYLSGKRYRFHNLSHLMSLFS